MAGRGRGGKGLGRDPTQTLAKNFSDLITGRTSASKAKSLKSLFDKYSHADPDDWDTSDYLEFVRGEQDKARHYESLNNALEQEAGGVYSIAEAKVLLARWYPKTVARPVPPPRTTSKNHVPKRPIPKPRTKTKSKPCPSGKILNPASGRCVSRTGKIGKKLI